MSERTSAGELQDRYIVKHKLLDFFDEMKQKMYENIERKGTSWRECSNKYLIDKLKENLEKEEWIDVANYAFMLQNNEIDPEEEQTEMKCREKCKFQIGGGCSLRPEYQTSIYCEKFEDKAEEPLSMIDKEEGRGK